MDKIIGMGNALVDVLVRIDDDSLLEKLHLPKGSMQLIQEDTLSEIRKYTSGMKIHRSTGGSAGNTVCALAALGANPGFIGKVGQDETGAFFGDTLRQRGVNALLATCDLPSGIASTFISTDGERTFGTYLGAAATLGLYSFSGWFIGMQNSRFPMFIAITQNIVNIVASLLFVFVFGMKVEGVALGTLIAQYAGLFMAYLLWLRYYRPLRKYISRKQLFTHDAMKRLFQVNRDIFLRTLCLVAVTVFFTSTGAAFGDVVLAVNTLLMQLFTLFSYIMDGFAYAGEALTGKYIGAGNRQELRRTIRHLFGWGIALSLAFTLLYGIGGKEFLGLLTNEQSVISASGDYFYWVLAIPLAGFAAFLLDGICIGATSTNIMLKAMVVASGSFFLIYYSLHNVLHNHALWLGFIVYLALRGIMQALLLNSSSLRTAR